MKKITEILKDVFKNIIILVALQLAVGYMILEVMGR